ncbi:MAG: CHASE2 domain-containing protein, partial [Rhodospirillales bacterium]
MTGDDKPKTAPRKPHKWGLKALLGNGRPVALAILAGLVLVMFDNPEPVEFIRLKTFDFYQSLKPRPIPEEKLVVIADLDDESLAAVGQWPWPRTTVARLVDN